MIDVGDLVDRNDGTTGWAQVSADVSTFSGLTIQIGFLGTSGFGNDVYLDDVVVSGSGSGPSTYAISGTVSSGGSGLAGVTVTAAGASTVTATTLSDGTYVIAGLANGSYTVTPSLSGYTFSPTSSLANVSGANVPSVSFVATAVPSTWSISGPGHGRRLGPPRRHRHGSRPVDGDGDHRR